MHWLRIAGLLLVLVTTPAAGPAKPGGYIDAELITQTLNPRPGSTIWIGLRMTPQAGWHGYWSNPGESGIAPEVEWSVPRGVRVGPLQHPAPTLFKAPGVVSFVHSGSHILLARLSLGAGLKAGTSLPLVVKARWAACSDNFCVPQSGTLSLTLVAGDGKPGTNAGALKRAGAALSDPAPRGSYSVADGKLRLQLPPFLALRPQRARFFPDDNGYLNVVEQRVEPHGPAIVAPVLGKVPATISGVVTDGASAYRLAFRRDEAAIKDRPAIAETEKTKPKARTEQRPTAASPSAYVPAQAEEPTDGPRTSPIVLAMLLIGGLAGASMVVLGRRR